MSKGVDKAARELIRVMRKYTHMNPVEDQEAGKPGDWTLASIDAFDLYEALDQLDSRLIRAGKKP